MDEYLVGSVADIISNTELNKVHSKKRKVNVDANNQSHITDVNCSKKKWKPSTVVSCIKSKSKNSLHLLDQSTVSNFSNKKLNTEPPSEVKENAVQPNKTKTSLKRTKSLVEFFPNSESYQKQDRDLLSLDHIPSDSGEEEEDNGLEKNLQKKKNHHKKETCLREYKENTIFIGNIPVNYDKQKICKVFSKFGKIQNARIRCVPVENINMSKKVAAIKKKFNPKRNSLVAYVKYKSQDSVYAALSANGMVINGHHIRVDFAEQNKERDNNKAVFVGGLPFDIEDDELWEFFQNCGEISSVRVIRDSQTSIGKGFGYVNFDSTASVELALQLDGEKLKKRTINVKRCVKARNKNKLNSFGRKKSEEVTNQFLCKKGKKFKEKKKLKKENNEFSSNFQGKTADMKQKKKKKLSKTALRQRKLVKILGAA